MKDDDSLLEVPPLGIGDEAQGKVEEEITFIWKKAEQRDFLHEPLMQLDHTGQRVVVRAENGSSNESPTLIWGPRRQSTNQGELIAKATYRFDRPAILQDIRTYVSMHIHPDETAPSVSDIAQANYWVVVATTAGDVFAVRWTEEVLRLFESQEFGIDVDKKLLGEQLDRMLMDDVAFFGSHFRSKGYDINEFMRANASGVINYVNCLLLQQRNLIDFRYSVNATSGFYHGWLEKYQTAIEQTLESMQQGSAP